jgi:hypothetical protein
MSASPYARWATRLTDHRKRTTVVCARCGGAVYAVNRAVYTTVECEMCQQRVGTVRVVRRATASSA